MVVGILRCVENVSIGTSTEVTNSANDVYLEFKNQFTPVNGMKVRGVIHNSNGGLEDSVWLLEKYPTLDLPIFKNFSCGASVIFPRQGIPGRFAVGTEIEILLDGSEFEG
jgi:hypothetical protein